MIYIFRQRGTRKHMKVPSGYLYEDGRSGPIVALFFDAPSAALWLHELFGSSSEWHGPGPDGSTWGHHFTMERRDGDAYRSAA